MQAWVPQTDGLHDIVNTLKGSIVPDTKVQQESYQRIEIFKKNPEFCCYLCYILVHLPSEQVGYETRQIAGLLLKRTIKESYHTYQNEVKDYMQKQVLPVLCDGNSRLRQAAGSIVTTIVSQSNLSDWKELMPFLVDLLKSSNEDAVSGGFDALVKLCEDSADKLVNCNTRPLNEVVPKVLEYFKHPKEEFRVGALKCVNHLMIVLPPALVVEMDHFLQGISSLTGDTSNEVRKLVCQSIVVLLEVGIQYLVPHMESIIQFIIIASQDDDENVAIEACEFWASFCDQPFFDDVKPMLEPYLPQVLPLLLVKMVYSQEDIVMFEAEEEEQNETVPDRPEDMKPIFHKIKQPNGENKEKETEEEEDDDGFGDFGEWNLRKCAAAALDILSQNFGNSILPVVLPLLQERLSNNGHWSIRESGILALGAIAEGCHSGILPHLQQLFPYLMHLMNDPAPLIRSITCWTLGRFSGWAVDQGNHETVMAPLVEIMLQRILDKNKKVQEAACSAFCSLEEEALSELEPYLQPILQSLMFALSKYQAKNLIILYDAIGTLADCIGDPLNHPEYISVLMPPLIAKWQSIPDNSRDLIPLLECFQSVAEALGPGFQDFVLPVYQRCIRLIETGLLQFVVYDQDPSNNDYPDAEFMVCALDLINGLQEAMLCEFAQLVPNTNFLQLVFGCVKDRSPEVRKSATAVVGDLAKHCMDVIRPVLSPLMALLLGNLETKHPSVCNNATWAIGEIAIQVRTDMETYIPDIMNRLVPILLRGTAPRNVNNNCAITIGRLIIVCPNIIAPSLNDFFEPWCQQIRDVPDQLDREHCFLGLCALIKANPIGAQHYLMQICDAILSWENSEYYEITSELTTFFTQILHGFKQNFGDNWTTYFQSFPQPLRERLISSYQL